LKLEHRTITDATLSHVVQNKLLSWLLRTRTRGLSNIWCIMPRNGSFRQDRSTRIQIIRFA